MTWVSFLSTQPTSPRTSYRSRRLFYKSHLSLILSRLLSKPQPLSLGCGLVSQIYTGIFFVNTSQSVASVISLAMSFFISLQSSPRAHFTAPRFQTGPAALGSGSGRPLCGRHIVRGDFFTKVTSHSFCRGSFPNRNHFRWVAVWFLKSTQESFLSTLPSLSQASYRLR